MNQFERLELLIGDEKLDKIKNSTVLVLGIGGVGSYVVSSLVRSGVQNIIIVDFDKIDVTNINRQLMANLNNIGLLKVDEMEKIILSINDRCNVIKLPLFINSDNFLELFNYDIDYFIDCCDTVNTKKLVIKECLDRNIKFITCCGTGNKFDPSCLYIKDIRKTSYDPLAKVIRSWVNKEKIKGEILCCTSSEEPIKTDNGKIGSNSFLPCSAGLLIGSYVIRDIIK